MPLVVTDVVEVIDETSPLYHRFGVVTGLTRAGRPIVEFRQRRRTWRHLMRGTYARAMRPEQVGVVPPPC